jgi:hypothetical protein
MTNRTRFLAVAFAVLCTAQARAGDDEPTDQVKLSATLAEVTSFPETYRRVPFELELLYHGPRELYNPYYTLFEPATYMNFAAWSADKAIWTRDGYVDDYPLFYVDRKTGVLEHQVVALKPFTWFTAKCIVKSTAQGRAWIEVLSISTTNTTLDRNDLRHLVKANVLASGGEFERSLLEFSMAKMTDAPARFVARYHVDQGRVALAANQPGRAMAELQAALPALPDDKELIALLDRATGNSTAPIAQPQVASAPTGAGANVPPPLNLNGGGRPAQKPNEPKRNDAPKSDSGAPATDANAPKSEPAKTAAPPAIDPMPADAPKGDAAPAAKPQPAPKSDAADAPKTELKPAAKTETPKVEAKPEAPKAEPKAESKSDAKPAPSGDGAKPVETPAPKGETPAPAEKPADAPEVKKDEAPAPSEPKPAETPESKPGDAPAEKPENAPEEKPAEPPADKPKPDNGG